MALPVNQPQHLYSNTLLRTYEQNSIIQDLKDNRNHKTAFRSIRKQLVNKCAKYYTQPGGNPKVRALLQVIANFMIMTNAHDHGYRAKLELELRPKATRQASRLTASTKPAAASRSLSSRPRQLSKPTTGSALPTANSPVPLPYPSPVAGSTLPASNSPITSAYPPPIAGPASHSANSPLPRPHQSPVAGPALPLANSPAHTAPPRAGTSSPLSKRRKMLQPNQSVPSSPVQPPAPLSPPSPQSQSLQPGAGMLNMAQPTTAAPQPLPDGCDYCGGPLEKQENFACENCLLNIPPWSP